MGTISPLHCLLGTPLHGTRTHRHMHAQTHTAPTLTHNHTHIHQCTPMHHTKQTCTHRHHKQASKDRPTHKQSHSLSLCLSHTPHTYFPHTDRHTPHIHPHTHHTQSSHPPHTHHSHCPYLVLDGGDVALGPPVHRVGQLLDAALVDSCRRELSHLGWPRAQQVPLVLVPSLHNKTRLPFLSSQNSCCRKFDAFQLKCSGMRGGGTEAGGSGKVHDHLTMTMAT